MNQRLAFAAPAVICAALLGYGYYLQYVRHEHPDVAVIDRKLLQYPFYLNYVTRQYPEIMALTGIAAAGRLRQLATDTQLRSRPQCLDPDLIPPRRIGHEAVGSAQRRDLELLCGRAGDRGDQAQNYEQTTHDSPLGFVRHLRS